MCDDVSEDESSDVSLDDEDDEDELAAGLRVRAFTIDITSAQRAKPLLLLLLLPLLPLLLLLLLLLYSLM